MSNPESMRLTKEQFEEGLEEQMDVYRNDPRFMKFLRELDEPVMFHYPSYSRGDVDKIFCVIKELGMDDVVFVSGDYLDTEDFRKEYFGKK